MTQSSGRLLGEDGKDDGIDLQMTESKELLGQLVGLNTTALTSNLRLIEFVEDLLDTHEIPHERVMSPDKTRANLIASIGPNIPGGIVLSAHTDCVSVDGQPWKRDPFTLDEENGRLYGRGTVDMKGFLAVMLGAVPMLARAELNRPVFLALSYDEEAGTVGAPSLVERLISSYPMPEAVIVGEPTNMQVVTAHKGLRAFTTIVRGVDAHSSQPHRAANAVAAATRIATFIDDIAIRQQESTIDPLFDPPYTTFNLATITGGQAMNIVPRLCELVWEYRPIPADDSDELRDEIEAFARKYVLPRLRAYSDAGNIEFRSESTAPALRNDHNSAAEALAREFSAYTGPSGSVSYGTDGGHFKAAGISTVVCGPGSIDQAHRPDEYVETSQIEACESFFSRLVSYLTR